jgi:chaperonin GroES
VVAAGPGKADKDGKRTPLQVSAGDRILFSKYAGSEIKIDGVEHIIMREDDILGILSE